MKGTSYFASGVSRVLDLMAFDSPAGNEKKRAKFVRLIWVDAAGLRRVRVVPAARFQKAVDEGVSVTAAIMALQAWGDVPAPGSGLGVSGEFLLVPDEATLQRVPWHPNHGQVLCDLHSPHGTPSDFCPRSALKRVLEAASEGYALTFRLGFESEFVLIQPRTGPLQVPCSLDKTVYAQTLSLLRGAAVLDDIAESLGQLGVEVEQYHPESASGQFEIVTAHETALKAVDNLVATRETVAGVSHAHDLVASFLPKPYANEAGNGCHMHFSIYKHTSPITSGMLETWPPLAKSFLAGILHHLPGLLPFLLPSPNSFARIAPGCWSGAFRIYGIDNKEAPLRICPTNIELKTLDAAANPYIAVAAVITAGLLGIKETRDLPVPCNDDPGALTEEQRAEREIDELPRTLESALEAFDKDTELSNALEETLGTPLIQAYLAVRRGEAAYFANKSFAEIVLALAHRY